MLKIKALSDVGWKAVVTRNKVKDPGMLKLLERLKKCPEDQHDEAVQALDEITKLAARMKKDKAIAAVSEVSEYLDEMLESAEDAGREVGKDKAAADKKAQAEAKAAAAAAKKKEAEDAEGEEDEQTPEVLTTKMLPLLKLAMKGQQMHALVATAGTQVAVMLSRKPIEMGRRKVLAEQLGGSGGIKYYPGYCTRENNATTFVLNREVMGLAKKVKLALLTQTGLRVNKLVCRGQDDDSADEDADER